MNDLLELADYRRRVQDLYAAVRAGSLPEPARCQAFRLARDQLFRTHAQSALSDAQKARFTGLRYFPYDPAFRFVVPVEAVSPHEAGVLEVPLRDDGLVRLRRAGRVRFAVDGAAVALTLFWLEGYGGGLFLPFRDRTSARETYEGGRYLLDTIKGADLGSEGDRLVLDFNYAYNPSCAYNPRWDCPLAPPENFVPVAIRAGEMRFPG